MVSCVFDLLFDLGWRMWLNKPLGDTLAVHYLENYCYLKPYCGESRVRCLGMNVMWGGASSKLWSTVFKSCYCCLISCLVLDKFLEIHCKL